MEHEPYEPLQVGLGSAGTYSSRERGETIFKWLAFATALEYYEGVFFYYHIIDFDDRAR